MPGAAPWKTFLQHFLAVLPAIGYFCTGVTTTLI